MFSSESGVSFIASRRARSLRVCFDRSFVRAILSMSVIVPQPTWKMMLSASYLNMGHAFQIVSIRPCRAGIVQIRWRKNGRECDVCVESHHVLLFRFFVWRARLFFVAKNMRCSLGVYGRIFFL